VFHLLRAVRAISATKKVVAGSARTPQQSDAVPFAIEQTAASFAIFNPGAGLRFLQVATSLGPVDIELTTRRFDDWGSVQHGIVANTKGVAPNGTDISVALDSVLEDLLSILSLSANAWVGSPQACDTDQPAGDLRELNEVATGALLDRIAAHPNAKELWQVARSYRQALAYWTSDQQSMALHHLHGGFLAMSDVLIRFFCEARGLTRTELAGEYRVPMEKLSKHVLEAELYQDDVLCFQAAEGAWQRVNSEGRQVIEDDDYAPDDVHVTAARYLRSSVIRVVELEDRYRSILLTSPYDVPLGAGNVTEPQRARWEVGSRRPSFARGPLDELERGSQT
jgi:hypothetical protein